MKQSNWKYKIGIDTFAFVPLSIALFVFGGISVWLYLADNGVFLFTGFITAVLLLLAVYNIYRGLVVKLLIDENGFYHQTKIGNGNYYKYSDITEAWQSEGRNTNGVVNHYLNYKTADGTVVKFFYTTSQEEGIEYLLARINGESEDSHGE
jgi:hypothetical protein